MNQNNRRPDLGAFAGVQSRLAAIATVLDTIDPDTILPTDLADIQTQLRALVASVAYATPNRVCPYCFGRGEGCRFCGGVGWVSDVKIRLAPPELAAMAEALGDS